MRDSHYQSWFQNGIELRTGQSNQMRDNLTILYFAACVLTLKANEEQESGFALSLFKFPINLLQRTSKLTY